jgi:dTDP-4-amino-4,6-dideoxygalactose transaminase
VFGWDTFAGPRQASIPSLLDAPRLAFTTSGRASIYQALKVLAIGAGDTVLIPTYHCPTMVAPVVALGAKPVFYPIGEQGEILPAAFAHLADTSTRAVMAPHYFGLPQPMAQLRQWCDATGVALIEDCAHALFGMAGERRVGEWGDLAIASLTKFLPLPEGGCLICNGTLQNFTTLERHGPLRQVKTAIDMLEEGARHHALPGMNVLLETLFGTKRLLRARPSPVAETEAPSAIPADEDASNTIDRRLADTELARPCRWLVEHATLDRIVANRRTNYTLLARGLAGSDKYRPLRPKLPDSCAPYVFPLWVEKPDPCYQQLRSRGIPLFRWDRLWPGTPDLPGDSGVAWSHHVFQLVCHQDLRPDEIERIVAHLRELCP